MRMHNPPHPGDFIRETYIEPFEISVRMLADNLGVASGVALIPQSETGCVMS
ncbi:MAG: hypothetical protein HKN42_10315 [Granulosicoccus sp.]|nr:hypothetical protein [Granulosicoccus sp.]